MKIEHIEELISQMDLRIAQRTGTQFFIELPAKKPEDVINKPVYPMYLCVSEKPGVIRYNSQSFVNDVFMGVLSINKEAGESLTPAEAHHLRMVCIQKNIDFYSVASPEFGAWKLLRNVHIAKDSVSIDTAKVYYLSEVLTTELLRGLHLDLNKYLNTSSFRSFGATNGVVTEMLGKYSGFGFELNQFYRSRITFNREIPRKGSNDTSIYVDLAAIPQSHQAVTKLSVMMGVEARNGKFHRVIDSNSASCLAHVPFRNIVNEKRMVVERASYQQLKLFKPQKPLVKVVGSPKVNGVNAVVLRDKSAPTDSFIVSKSFAESMLAFDKVEIKIELIKNTKITPLGISKTMTKEEIQTQVSMNLFNHSVKKGAALFSYFRLPWVEPVDVNEESLTQEQIDHLSNSIKNLDSVAQTSDNQSENDELSYQKEITVSMIEKLINTDKEVVVVRSKLDFTPTSYTISDGYRQGECTIVTIYGYRITSLKVGSKLIDRFSSKGTVSKIVPDNQMPTVHWNGIERRVDVICNPSIYKRKVALAYKSEGLLSMYAALVDQVAFVSRTANLQDLIEVRNHIKESGIDIRKPSTLTYPDGKKVTTFKVGIHYFFHLDHDPKDKLIPFKSCTYSDVDRAYFTKFGIIRKPNFDKVNIIGKVLGKKVQIKGYQYEIVDTDETPDLATCVNINRKLDRNFISKDVGLLPPILTANTVADKRLLTNWGVIRTNSGNVFIPPGIIAPMQGNQNQLILPTELVTANAIVSEQQSVDFCIKKKLPGLQYSMNKLQRLISVYHNQLMKRLQNEATKEYKKGTLSTYGVASCDDTLPPNTIGIPHWIYKTLERKGFGQVAIVRRHPIHRIFNMLPVKLVPNNNYTITIRSDMMEMMDGDFDGDALDVVYVTPVVGQQLIKKYANLRKGWNDIKAKKSTTREKRTTGLSWDQADMKLNIALAGSAGNILVRTAMLNGLPVTQAAQLFHYSAQYALNLKHKVTFFNNINLMTLISSLSEIVRLGKPMYDKFAGIAKIINPNFTDRDIAKLRYLLKLIVETNIGNNARENDESLTRLGDNGQILINLASVH